MKQYPPNVHPQLVFTYLKQRYDLPEVWYIDLWPFGPTFMALSSADAAAYAVQTRGYGKHTFVDGFMTNIVGKQSIVAINGPLWKNVQHMLLPAFKPSAVRGLLQPMAEETRTYRKVLEGAAEKGEPVKMELLLSDLSFQVGTVLVGAVLGIVSAYHITDYRTRRPRCETRA